MGMTEQAASSDCYGSFDSFEMAGFNFLGSGMSVNQILGFHWIADAEF